METSIKPVESVATITVGNSGDILPESGAEHCNYVVILDKFSGRGAIIHTDIGIAELKEGTPEEFGREIITKTCAEIGFNLGNKDYIKNNIVTIILHVKEAADDRGLREDAERIQRIFERICDDLGLPRLETDINDMWGKEVRFLIEEGMILAFDEMFPQKGSKMHVVSLLEPAIKDTTMPDEGRQSASGKKDKGAISEEEEQAQGTTFTIRLPVGEEVEVMTQHFDFDGTAIDGTGRELAIKQYQMAINSVIAWVNQQNIPITNVAVYGSSTMLDKRMPRLGIWNTNTPRMELLYTAGHKGGPSDIDINILFNKEQKQALSDEIQELHNKIFEETGVMVQFWSSQLRDAEPSVPISEFAGEGLINTYRKVTEQTHATLLEDQLKLIDEDEPTIIAVGTSSYPGYDDMRYPMHHTMNPLITSLNGPFKDRPVTFVVAKDDALEDAINEQKKVKGYENARVLVLAGKDTVQRLKNKIDKRNMIGIDNKNLLIDNYIPLMEMLTVLIKFSKEDTPEEAIKRIQEEHPRLGAQLIDGFIIFQLPKAEPMDYEELREIYKLQTSA